MISEIKLKEDNWKTENIIKISHKLIEKFTSIEKASQKEDVELMNCFIIKISHKLIEKFTSIEKASQKEDVELINCLTILHFISCNYQKDLFYF